METNNKMREIMADLLYMAERYAKKTPATATVIFDPATKKEMRTICYYDVIAKARAALAEPVRNCEVGTAEEQEKRYAMFVKKHWTLGKTALQWAQMPYKKKDAK